MIENDALVVLIGGEIHSHQKPTVTSTGAHADDDLAPKGQLRDSVPSFEIPSRAENAQHPGSPCPTALEFSDPALPRNQVDEGRVQKHQADGVRPLA